MIAQAWAMVATSANFAVHHPAILIGGLALAASAITTLIVSELRNK